jgi:pimeloyl-ACP methyl ester carboxylesterase
MRKLLIALFALLSLAAVVGLRGDLPAAEVDSRYQGSQSHFVTLADGTRMHYLEAGAASAPPLLLVHGSFDSCFSWERVMPELARDFHVFAPDLPAHGLTGKTARDRYAMQDMVAAVHGLTTKLGLSRFDIAGNSMGGNTSWLYALAHPERVRRMVLIDAAGYPLTGGPLVDTHPNPVKRWLYLHGNPSLLMRRGFERAVADPASVSDAFVERAVVMLRRDGSRLAQAERNRVRDITGQPFARIREIQTPTLVVWGERDQLLSPEGARRFHADLPNDELKLYAGIGHMPQLEAPARLVADMREFLARP